MKIGLDVMGGDFAPDATLNGAVLALSQLDAIDRIVLIGPEDSIRNELSQRKVDDSLFDIVDASEVIGMGEHPVKSLNQKPNSTLSVGFHLLKHKKIDAFASAGNSGAMLVGSMYSVNVVDGVTRPCTTTIVPQEKGGVSILVDVGTNPDAKPEMLCQFAKIASVYANEVLKIESPRIALLNIGEEEEKGNLTCLATFPLLKESKALNFVGNIEGRDLFRSKADVIVCDGYTGNIVLKSMEAMYRMVAKRGFTDEYLDRFNYENYGGTPILGVNAPVILGHGISNDLAIKNMVLLARDVQIAGLPEKIKQILN